MRMKKLGSIKVESLAKGHKVGKRWEAQALPPALPLGQDLGL